jgi:hypothetical protein
MVKGGNSNHEWGCTVDWERALWNENQSSLVMSVKIKKLKPKASPSLSYSHTGRDTYQCELV